MKRKDRALRRREVAAALDPLGFAGNFAHRLLDVGLPAGLDHFEQAAADDVDRSCQKILQLRTRQIIALTDRERQHAVLAGAPDQHRISGMRKLRPRIAGGAPDHLAVAAAHDDVGEIGRKLRPLRHRQQMTLALEARNFDQGDLIDDGRSAQQRTCDRYLVLARELPDQPARGLCEHGQPLGEVGTRGNFGVGNQINQNAVKQIDVLGPEIRGTMQEQFADPARGLGAAVGIAVSDDFIKPGNQRGGDCH